MSSFFLTSATGRVAVILFGLDILIPYILRRSRLSRGLGLGQGHSSKYLHRMWPHHWCGYLLLVFSTGHAWISMQLGNMTRMNMSGLLFATIAVGLLILQVALGLLLKDRQLQTRKLIRRWHYWTMLALIAPGAAHV